MNELRVVCWLNSNEFPVMLAEQDLTVYFSKAHVIDLKAVLDAEDALPATSAPEDKRTENLWIRIRRAHTVLSPPQQIPARAR
jgi:hypothetical protein